MPFSAEELEQLAGVIEAKVKDAVAGHVEAAVADAVMPKPQVNDEPQNQPDNQPDFYVHLSNGAVFRSKNTGSHMEDPATGETCMVIGRYPVGE
jgi:hypothetical protein